VAYRFDHQWKQERGRLAALEAVFDPHSQRRHDIVSDPLEREELDLIHSRAVLGHLPERDAGEGAQGRGIARLGP